MKIHNYILLAIVGMLAPSVCYAYVDPGSGSVIVTAILGFIAAIGYTSRKYFYKFKRLLFGDNDEEKPRELDNVGDEK